MVPTSSKKPAPPSPNNRTCIKPIVPDDAVPDHPPAALTDRAANLFALAGGCLLLAIIGVTATNTSLFIADRIAALFDSNVHGLSGYEDFTGLATGTAILLMLPYCQAQRGHLAVDVLAQRLPARLNLALGVVWAVLMAVAAAGLGIALVYGMIELRSDMAVSRVLGWPIWPFLLPGCASLALWAIISARQALAMIMVRAAR